MIKTILERRRQERRRCPRISENLIVYCSNEENPLPTSGYTEDISKMGIRIISNILFSPREKVFIELYQPYEISKQLIFSIHLIGEVAWTEELKIAEKGKVATGYRLGLSFLDGADKDINMIDNYIKDFSKKIEPANKSRVEYPFNPS